MDKLEQVSKRIDETLGAIQEAQEAGAVTLDQFVLPVLATFGEILVALASDIDELMGEDRATSPS